MREVAGLADPECPIQVSQRRWDQARKQSARFAGLPLARDIARRLTLPWCEVLQLALAPPETHAHRLGRALTRVEQDWLTDEHIVYALRMVAGRLDIRTLTPGQYRAERTRMLALDRTRWLHGRRLRLPTDEQIRRAVAGDWDHALALARLAPRPGLGDQGHGRRALGTLKLLERCYEAHGTEPTAAELRCFAKANGIPWNPDKDRTWLESLAAWKDDRRARGQVVPDGPPPRSERPNYAQPIGAALPGERRRQDWSDINACLLFVVAYLEQLPTGARSTKLGYADWARAHENAPAPSCFDQHGGWEQLRLLAHEAIFTSKESATRTGSTDGVPRARRRPVPCEDRRASPHDPWL